MKITFNENKNFDLIIKIINSDSKDYKDLKLSVINGNLTLSYNLKGDIIQSKLENAGWDILKYLKENNFENIDLTIDGSIPDSDNVMFSILTGLELSNYEFNKYFCKEKKEKTELKTKVLNVNIKDVNSFKTKYKEFLPLKENIFFCRDIVNEPSNIVNPESYAKICKDLQKIGLKVDILTKKKLEKLGMNAILAVGQGSIIEPRVVIIRWNGTDAKEKPIALVGKGLTFDSGGLSLKPENAMYDMKCDMAGSAVVVSTMKLLAERKAKVNAVGVIGLVENMPSGSAIKPGDIVKSMSGQTIEILNTDAEGRVVLADLLYYTSTKFKPSAIFDFATLTGAICIALGECLAGIFTNNDNLAKIIEKSSNETLEFSWRMPLGKIGSDYDIMMDSEVADVKNISCVKYGGAITAAQFLQRFINKHDSWVHMDIAGTAFTTKKAFFVNKDATGFGVRLMNNLIKNNYEK